MNDLSNTSIIDIIAVAYFFITRTNHLKNLIRRSILQLLFQELISIRQQQSIFQKIFVTIMVDVKTTYKDALIVNC